MANSNHTRPLRALYERARCVFFDCDGVIFDSNGFKIEAMRLTLASHTPAEIAQMEAHWRSNGGASRFVKFEHFYTQIAPHPDLRAATKQAAERFGALSLSAYQAVEPIAEAIQLAKATGAERCHVVSGAAEVELHSVFAAKGIQRHFATIQGSPRPKRELVEKVLSEYSCAPGDALLIGDGAMDFRVSQELGIHFVYLAQFSEWTDARARIAGAEGVSVAETWAELLSALLPASADRSARAESNR
jgi:phosphoglycolate phosphatase-like HAD superfamily hydrolase